MALNIRPAREPEEWRPQAYASDGSDGVGFVTFWGNSPALDLVADSEYPVIPTSGELSTPEEDEPLNVLISGAADLRHVLKTVAHAHRHTPQRAIHFYLHEFKPETLARHVLFLLLLTDRAMPARERAEVFLSLYGNTLVREKDAEWLHNQVNELLNIITSQSSSPISSILDLSALKFKERDEVQEVFEGWRKTQAFDIEKLREQRCRGYYRERYDYRTNLLDWDFHNGIRNVCPIIHWQHFKEFGLSGVAFETRLGTYGTPNRTMASYQEGKSRTKGTTIMVRGYWGDIVNPPYMAFGIDAEGEDRARLFKRSNEQYRENSVSISLFNVIRYLQELDTGIPLRLPPATEKEDVFPYESPLDRLHKVEELQPEEAAPELPQSFQNGKVKVSLIAGDLADTLKKSKFAKKFHRAFFGNLAVAPLFREADLMDGETGAARKGTDPMLPLPEDQFASRQGPIAGSLADNAVVVTDSFKYQVHFDGRTKLGYRRRVQESAHRLGWGMRRPRTATPRLEPDMKDLRARELDAQADDFLSFVVGQPPEAPPAGEPIDLTPDDDLQQLDDEVPTDVGSESSPFRGQGWRDAVGFATPRRPFYTRTRGRP